MLRERYCMTLWSASLHNKAQILELFTNSQAFAVSDLAYLAATTAACVVGYQA